MPKPAPEVEEESVVLDVLDVTDTDQQVEDLLTDVEASELPAVIPAAHAHMPPIFALADMLFRGARSMIPKGVRTPAELVAIILTGQELGLGAMTSLRALYIVDGNVTMKSETMLAFMARAGIKYKWKETTDKTATLWAQREGYEPFQITWTLEMAKRAKLTGKYNWKSYPDVMLRARTTSALAKAYCPDVLLGAYTPEELEGLSYAAAWEPAEAIINTNLLDDEDDEEVIEL